MTAVTLTSTPSLFLPFDEHMEEIRQLLKEDRDRREDFPVDSFYRYRAYDKLKRLFDSLTCDRTLTDDCIAMYSIGELLPNRIGHRNNYFDPATKAVTRGRLFDIVGHLYVLHGDMQTVTAGNFVVLRESHVPWTVYDSESSRPITTAYTVLKFPGLFHSRMVQWLSELRITGDTLRIPGIQGTVYLDNDDSSNGS